MTDKTIIAAGKFGPDFDPRPSPTVQDAFERAAEVGLTRQDFARLAMLCLDEASNRDGYQAAALRRARAMLIEADIYTPRPHPYEGSVYMDQDTGITYIGDGERWVK